MCRRKTYYANDDFPAPATQTAHKQSTASECELCTAKISKRNGSAQNSSTVHNENIIKQFSLMFFLAISAHCVSDVLWVFTIYCVCVQFILW